MSSVRYIFISFIITCLLCITPAITAGSPVHRFHCKECHLSNLTIDELGGANVCLTCHNPTAGDMTPNDGAPPELDGHTEGRFVTGDASNAFGHGTGLPSADQTSHTWSAPSDTLAAAGAQAPVRLEHPEFYSRYGTSTGKLTCSRCHDPHGEVETNPMLLVKGADSNDVMCRACHALWDQADNHGWLTHPVVDSYNTAIASQPDKYRTTLVNKDNADIKLVDGGVSCTSCHGLHFVDSDATTPDGVAHINDLSQSDGKLLSGNGPEQTDKSSLCQTCHIYKEHGDDNGEKPGCLVCHSGHSYDPDYPNYFVLRKSATTTTYNTVTGLDYSSPSVLVDELKYTFWNDRTDGTAEGYCEKCHGDAKDIGSGAGNYHVAAAICTDCHYHAGSTFVYHDGGSGSGCESCHGHDVGYEYTPGEFSEGIGTTHSHSTHTENDADDLRGPNIGCNSCHDINNFPNFKSGTDSDGNGVYSLSETDVCNTCHSPTGTYDGVDDATLGAKPNWDAGIYNGLTLQAGKEKWCATCHDESPSVINSVNAPNVIGDEDGSYIYGTGWGYYKTGHGLAAGENYPSKGGVETLSGRPVECDSCHDYATAHVDGESRTYDDGDALVQDPAIYRQGYRLKMIDGQEPMLMPLPRNTGHSVDHFRVCFQIGCHDPGPFMDQANMNTNLVTDGINRHESHLVDEPHDTMFASDWSGAGNSRMTCVNCHNVHGSTRLAMVRDGKLVDREPGLQIWYKNDAVTYYDVNTWNPPEPEDLPLSASDGTVWLPGTSTNLCGNCHTYNIRAEDRDKPPFQDIAQAPLLEWEGSNGLTSDGVTPDNAVGNSTFTFRVTYSDINNDSPSPIEVWVDQNDNGSYDAGEKYTMAETDATDMNIYNGKNYTKSVSIAKVDDGVLNYRFYAYDGGLEATGAPTANSTVTILNNPPTLAWTGEDFYQADGTNPDNGGNGDTFTFRIDYTDSDNDAPSAIQVWVDEDDNGYDANEKHTLTEVDNGDLTYGDGKLYTYNLPIAHSGDGNLNYRFYAADGNIDATGDPTQDAVLTVQAGANSPPSLEFVDAECTVSGVKPQTGATGADFIFTVRYVDHENEGPSTIQAWIDENDVDGYEASEKYVLTEVDSGDTTYSDGKLYTTSRALTLAGDNVLSYRFYATDGTNTAVGEAASDHSVTVVDALKVRNAGGSGWDSTIQSAIDAIDGAHTVLVYEGTYNEDVLFEFGNPDKNTELRSVCGPDATIINGSGTGAVVTFYRYSNSQIDGFQVTGGTTGINVTGADSQATITNCQIHDNHGLYGGGISVDNSVLTLTNSEIYNNSSDRGAGVRIWRGSGHIIDNTIIRNNTAVADADGAFDGGGGLHLSQIPNMTISNSIIKDNVSDYPGGGLKIAQVTGLIISDSIISGNTTDSWGGGVLSDLSKIKFVRSSITGNTSATMGGAIATPSAGNTISFENCILADNQALQAGMAKLNGGTLDIVNSVIANNRATEHSGAIYNQLATITIHNSILWGNKAGSVGHFAHFNNGSITITNSIIQNDDDGDLTDAPFFTDGGTTTVSSFVSEDDPWFVGDGDYHILPPSPAIDHGEGSGAPAEDIDGDLRPQMAGFDIGVDELPGAPGTNVPSLNWTRQVNYAADGIDPDTGSCSPTYEFRVKYTDIDNDAPTVLQLWVDLNDDGDYDDGGEKFNMTAVGDGDGLYATGENFISSANLDFTIIADNTINYRFYASDGTFIAKGPATSDMTISEGEPSVTITSALQTIGEKVTVWYPKTSTITLQLSANSTCDVTIPFSAGGASTATAGGDYSFSANPVTITAGNTTGTFTVTSVDDVLVEGNETIIVQLGTPANATLGADTERTITIIDDDD